MTSCQCHKACVDLINFLRNNFDFISQTDSQFSLS